MKTKIAYLILGLVFIFLNLSPVPKYLRSATFSVTSPVTKIVNGAYLKSSYFIKSFSNIGALIKENDNLRTQVSQLQRDLLIMTEENENIALEGFYNEYYGFNKDTVLTANVLEFYVLGEGRYITINKGEKDQIEKGDNVVIQRKLIGYVSSTSINSSTVKLIDSTNTQIPVKVSGKNTFGSLSCNQICVIEKIPIQDDVLVGDLVITSGTNGQYLPSLLVGNVSSVNDAPTSAFKFANVNYQIIPSKLYKVVVLLSNE